MTDPTPPTPLGLSRIEDFRALIGQTVGPTGWVAVTQSTIDRFAAVTGDDQWIHVDLERAAAGPFGGTIAHGLFSLSLGPKFLMELFDFTRFAHSLNYGYEKVRFPSPMRVPGRIRMSLQVVEVKDVRDGAQVTLQQTFEAEFAEKPICVAMAVGWFVDQPAPDDHAD